LKRAERGKKSGKFEKVPLKVKIAKRLLKGTKFHVHENMGPRKNKEVA
jgi:hypothetical protein